MLGNLDKLEVENIDDNDEVLNISLSPKVNQK